MQKKKRSVFESSLIAIVIILTLTLGLGLYARRAKVQKSKLLSQELSMFRSSISLYRIINKKWPGGLDELVSSKYSVNSKMRPYLTLPKSMNKNSFFDPFGNSYSYDSKTGWIMSKTSGYAQW